MKKLNERKWVVSWTAAAVLSAVLFSGCGSRDSAGSGSAAPTATATPEVTQEAEQTVTPEVTQEAEQTVTPEVTQEAEQTAAPEATQGADTPEAGTSQGTDASTPQTVDPSQNFLQEEEAQTIALTDAGMKEEDLSGIRVRLEMDDGTWEYEVDFYVGNQEYDYDIDAVSGQIRSKDMDIDDDFHWGGSSAGSTGTDGALSEADIRKIALDRVPGATEQDIRMHLDNDDGRMIYEGSIVYNEREYDFEIGADDGRILEWEEESIYDD